ncbi:MAG: hypothetical protein H6704_28060 [Myxococcales bacterium]|nr:hypothetical protein [Myxococcales bacterium]
MRALCCAAALIAFAGCAEDADDGAPPDGATDAAAADATPDADLRADADTRPMCDLAGVGMGLCCDIRAPDGSSARGVCREGRCVNSRFGVDSAYCAE